jgi:hypothetical protein
VADTNPGVMDARLQAVSQKNLDFWTTRKARYAVHASTPYRLRPRPEDVERHLGGPLLRVPVFALGVIFWGFADVQTFARFVNAYDEPEFRVTRL